MLRSLQFPYPTNIISLFSFSMVFSKISSSFKISCLYLGGRYQASTKKKVNKNLYPMISLSQTNMVTLQREFFCASSVRGYHRYFKETAVCIGDILFCDKEEDNNHDEYAVAVKTDCEIVGHVHFELSELFYEFLKDNHPI